MNLHEALQHPGRLAVLRQTALLDTPTEEAFDRLTRLAVTVFNAPTALVSLVDADRQFFKSCVGLPEPWSSARQTPLSHSFCQHTIVSGEPLVIEDARQHPLVRENLAIRDLGVVAYLGIPLLTAAGHVLGTFCVIDAVPRAWTPAEVGTAQDLAASVITEIELRAARADLERQVAARTAELRAANRRLRADRRQLQELSRRLVNVQEAERQQLARELHDEIGQLLTGLKLSLEMSQRLHGDALLEHLR